MPKRPVREAADDQKLAAMTAPFHRSPENQEGGVTVNPRFHTLCQNRKWPTANDLSLGTLPSQVAELIHSEASGINSAGRVVGKSWGSTTGASTSRALIVNYPGLVAPRDLNDRHIVRLSTSWSLEEAVAINDQNQIVCLGTIVGAKRAFLLMPRQMAY